MNGDVREPGSDTFAKMVNAQSDDHLSVQFRHRNRRCDTPSAPVSLQGKRQILSIGLITFVSRPKKVI